MISVTSQTFCLKANMFVTPASMFFCCTANAPFLREKPEKTKPNPNKPKPIQPNQPNQHTHTQKKKNSIHTPTKKKTCFLTINQTIPLKQTLNSKAKHQKSSQKKAKIIAKTITKIEIIPNKNKHSQVFHLPNSLPNTTRPTSTEHRSLLHLSQELRHAGTAPQVHGIEPR